MSIADKGISSGKVVSLVPGVSLYHLMDTGLVLQANWGGTEFLKDPHLNEQPWKSSKIFNVRLRY